MIKQKYHPSDRIEEKIQHLFARMRVIQAHSVNRSSNFGGIPAKQGIEKMKLEQEELRNEIISEIISESRHYAHLSEKDADMIIRSYDPSNKTTKKRKRRRRVIEQPRFLKFVCSWNKVPGSHSQKLILAIERLMYVKIQEPIKFIRTDDKEILTIISNDGNYWIDIELNQDENYAILTSSDARTRYFELKKKFGSLGLFLRKKIKPKDRPCP